MSDTHDPRANTDPVKRVAEDPRDESSTTDPVTGFNIPGSWLEKSEDRDILEKVRSGRWVLLSDGRLLYRGLTTGTTAAAACKGAVLSAVGRKVEEVEVPTPAGIRVRVAVRGEGGLCTATKEGGDHQADVTAGVCISARAKPSEDTHLVAGEGIGRITRSGLCAPCGKPAISQTARRQIMAALREGLVESGLKGARVELSIPRGETLAKDTLNPDVGVVGGISILGSTGFVEPWNEHLGEDVAEEVKSLQKVVVTTGRLGLRYSRVLFPDHHAVLVGSQLDRLDFRADQDSVLCGLPGLILRWAMPQILEGTKYATVAEMIENEPGHPRIETALAKATKRLPHTRILLINRNGSTLRAIHAADVSHDANGNHATNGTHAADDSLDGSVQ